jgi:Uma2 family endonuclease
MDRLDRLSNTLYESGVVRVGPVDLEAETITAYREPRPLGYAATRIAIHGDTLSPLALPELVVSVDELFPPEQS